MLTVSVDLLALVVFKDAIDSFFDAVDVTDLIELGLTQDCSWAERSDSPRVATRPSPILWP